MSVTLTLAIALVALATVLHYHALRQASRIVRRHSRRPALVLVGAVFTAIVAHTVEIALFSLGYRVCLSHGRLGRLVGDSDGTLSDCNHFSFVTYTSLGYGDFTPEGPPRILAALEALAGLVLVAWTASFLFLQMQRLWRDTG